jgi:hypothetical protein
MDIFSFLIKDGAVSYTSLLSFSSPPGYNLYAATRFNRPRIKDLNLSGAAHRLTTLLNLFHAITFLLRVTKKFAKIMTVDPRHSSCIF